MWAFANCVESPAAAAELINCGLYRIDDVSVAISEQDNPYFMKRHYGKPDRAAPHGAD
jgi:hypothetical protein